MTAGNLFDFIIHYMDGRFSQYGHKTQQKSNRDEYPIIRKCTQYISQFMTYRHESAINPL